MRPTRGPEGSHSVAEQSSTSAWRRFGPAAVGVLILIGDVLFGAPLWAAGVMASVGFVVAWLWTR